MNNRLCKIVYFDEDSVTDYIQIIMGGKLEKTTELLNEGSDSGETNFEAKAGLGIGKMLKALVGFDAAVDMDASLSKSFDTHEMAKNIIKNTILTDFIEVINTADGKDKTIKKFKGYNISVHKDSLTYVALIAPYLSMLKSGTKIPAGEFDVAVDKLDNTIKTAKGYYEFLGTCNESNVVFRFNIKSFKNNYKVTDLLKMDIVIYAIRVGKTTLEKLNFNSELNIDPENILKDNPSYEREQITLKDRLSDKTLDVYDVLLAGVEANG